MTTNRKVVATIACLFILVLSGFVVVRCSTVEFGTRPDAEAERIAPATEADVSRYVTMESRRGNGRLTPGNRVDLLVDGAQTYEAMLEAVAEARHHVHLETYIIEDDETGKRIADALTERRRAGVDVRVIYDGYGSTDSNAFWRRMRDAGVQLHEFNPPEPTENFDFSEYDSRDHRKILVVDGRLGFTGGINFYNAYTNGSSRRKEGGGPWRLPSFGSGPDELSWRDTHVRLDGPAVAELQRIFVSQWEKNQSGIDHDALFPALHPVGEERVRFEIGVGGNERRSETYAAFLDVFEEAKARIWITQAYFVPNVAFREALASAARRGVDVRLIVPAVTDVSLILYASRSLYGDLLEAGVRIYEFQDAVLHAKTAVADGAWSVVGSSNLDNLSFLRNDEVDAVIIGRRFAEEMEVLFLDDLQLSREISLDQWRSRPVGYKLMGFFAGWLEPWL